MLRRSALALLTPLLIAAPASAAGVSLRWDACLADGGVSNRSFACDTNEGQELLFASFELDEQFHAFTGVEAVFDIATAGSTLPSWWRVEDLGAAGCRAQSLQILHAFDHETPACRDAFGGCSISSLVEISPGARGPNTLRLRAVVYMPCDVVVDLEPDREYLAITLRLDHQKTVSGPACEGCDVGACLVLNLLDVCGSGGCLPLTTPANGTDSQFMTWQGGGLPVVAPAFGCPAATSVARRTWGAVKSLYR